MEDRELRVGLVMTGGVSLAVWMGGVAGEVYQLHSRSGIYGDLCDLTATQVVVDVISGTSAGGLNGALLAAAISRELPSERFSELRSLWLTAGSFDALLRKPFRKNPPSLLLGDDYFTGQLQQLLELWTTLPVKALEDEQLTVILTSSLLTPELLSFMDDFGTRIVEPSHRGRFTFLSRHFDDDDIAARLALAARTSASFPGAFEASYVPIGTTMTKPIYRPDMASVSNFHRSHWAVDGGVLMNKPVEPALEAIEQRSSRGEIRRVVAYVNPDPGERHPEVDVFEDQPTIGDVVLKSLLSLPRAESIVNDLDQLLDYNRKTNDVRNLRDALIRGVDIVPSGLPAPSGTVDAPALRRIVPLEETAEMLYPYWIKRRSKSNVGVRMERFFARAGVDQQDAVAAGNAPTFGELRLALEKARAALGWLPSQLPVAGPGDNPVGNDGQQRIDLSQPDAEWRWDGDSLEYIADLVLDLIQRAYALLPVSEPLAATATGSARTQLAKGREETHAALDWLRVIGRCDGDYWSYGLTHLDQHADRDCLMDLATSLYRDWPGPPPDLLAPRKEKPSPADDERREQWAAFALLVDPDAKPTERLTTTPIRAVAAYRDQFVAQAARGSAERDPIDALIQRLAEARESLRPGARIACMAIGRQLVEILLRLTDAFQLAELAHREWFGPSEHRVADDCLPKMDADDVVLRDVVAGILQVRTVPGVRSGHDVARVLHRLLCLYVVHTATVDSLPEHRVRTEFMQISAFASNQLDQQRRTPADKVAGLQVGHFGAFMKRSWRANDWMWGALDGAGQMVLVMLEPARLRQRFRTPDDALAEIKKIATGTSPGIAGLLTDSDRAHLDVLWADAEASIVGELEYLDREAAKPVPKRLDCTVATISGVAQMLVAQRELPAVAHAVSLSATDGGAMSLSAREFLDAVDDNQTERLGPDGVKRKSIPLNRTSRLLRLCQVGREAIEDELKSDRGATTAALAAAVASTAVAGTKAGVGFLRVPFAAMRTAILTVYIAVAAAARKSRLGFALSTALLAFAGGVLAARLLGASVSGPLVAISFALFAVWLVYTGLSAPGGRFAVLGAIPPLAIVGLSFIEPDQACTVFASTCKHDGSSVARSGAYRWGPWAVLAVLAVMCLARWREERADRKIRALTTGVTFESPILGKPPARMGLYALGLIAAGAVYSLVGNHWLFYGDGTRGIRSGFINGVEWLGRNRALVTFVVLPAVFVALNLASTYRSRMRTRKAVRRALSHTQFGPVPFI